MNKSCRIIHLLGKWVTVNWRQDVAESDAHARDLARGYNSTEYFLMNMFKALVVASLMTVSVAAMAKGSDGGDKVMAQMEARRDVVMADYAHATQANDKASAVAATQKPAAPAG